MIEYSQIAALLVSLISLVITATDGRLVKRLRANGATTQDTATEIKKCNRLMRWRLHRLQQKGIVFLSAPHAYYIDESAYTAIRRRKRIYALIAFALISIFLLLIFIIS